MFNSTVLDVVIGLVFIYLLYSLLASIIQELISTNFGLRAKVLKRGIMRMLDDGDDANTLSGSFYKHPLIKYLGENKIHSKPSYLSSKNFSKVLVDLLRGEDAQPGQNFAANIQKALDSESTQWGGTKINKETLTYLRSMWADAEGNVEKFKAKLEQWYDDTMDRVSGWYKKEIQVILFAIGFSLAIIFNIDTIAIVKKLSHDPKLATQLANNASAYMQTHKDLGEQLQENAAKHTADTASKNTDSATTAQLDSISRYVVVQSNKLIDSADAMIQNDIRSSNELMGMGWKCRDPKHADELSIAGNFHWWSIIGWFVTALAISLGAPFWFDLLSKLMKVRGSGETTDEDKNKKAGK